MTETERQLFSISLHEASHATTALSLGLPVTYVDMSILGGAVAGQTYIRFPVGTGRCHRVAVYVAGVTGANLFADFKLVIPDNTAAPFTPRTAAARREARAVERFRFGQLASESGSDWSGDLGAIRAVLSSCQHPNRIFARAEDIARRCLDRNERLVRTIAQQLLFDGRLSGGTLARLAKDITTYEHM